MSMSSSAVICHSKPRTRYTIGSEAALLWLTRVASDRFLDRMLRLALRPHYVTNASYRSAAMSAR